MNSQLAKYIPSDSTPEEFQKAWDNADYVLIPLYKVLEELISNNNKVKGSDFDCPNHYAKLAFQAGENKAYEYIKSLLPPTCKD